MEVTQNDESYTTNNIRFTYLPVPRVSRISVDRGPITGDTRVLLFGSNFTRESHALCKFGYAPIGTTSWGTPDRKAYGEHVVNATVLYRMRDQPLVCYTPWNTRGQEIVHLEMTLNGQDYTTDQVCACALSSLTAPSLSLSLSLTPPSLSLSPSPSLSDALLLLFGHTLLRIPTRRPA